MKTAFYASLLWIFAFCLLLADDGANAAQDKARIKAILERVRNGDAVAIDEASGLDATVAVPALQAFALRDTSDPDRTEKAREALKKVKGGAQYLERVIQARAAVKGLDIEVIHAFKTMSVLGTKEAIAATAPFLFDKTLLRSGMEDVADGTVDWLAARALGMMRLPDAPTSTRPDFYQEEDVQKWREWWLKNKARYAN